MNEQLWQQAKTLAARNYGVRVVQDTLSDGSVVFMASTPELTGCKSQGTTHEEATANLSEARIDYIYSLLEDGLPVPDPLLLFGSLSTPFTTTAGNWQNYTFGIDFSTPR